MRDPRHGSRSCQWLAANCVKTMWLAEWLFTKRTYGTKKCAFRYRLQRYNRFQDSVTDVIQSPHLLLLHKDMIQHSPSHPFPFRSALDKQSARFSACFHPLHYWFNQIGPVIHSTPLIPPFLSQSSLKTSTTAIQATPSSNCTHTQCLSLLAL